MSGFSGLWRVLGPGSFEFMLFLTGWLVLQGLVK